MRSGDRCGQCSGGRMRTYCSRTVGMSRIRFLKCSNCDATGQEIVGVDDLGRSILRSSTKPSIGKDSSEWSQALLFTEATSPNHHLHQ